MISTKVSLYHISRLPVLLEQIGSVNHRSDEWHRIAPRLAFIVLLLMLTGCARLPIREDIPSTPVSILASLEAQHGCFQRYTAIGSMTFHGDSGSISLECRWEIRLPDTIRIRLYGPLGFRLGDMLVEGKQVQIFNYWLDQQQSISLDSMVMYFPGMVALSSAKDMYPFAFVSRDDLAAIDPIQTQLDHGILAFEDSSGFRRIHIDEKYLIVTKELFRTAHQHPFLVKEYRNYRRTGRSWLPSQIRFSEEQSNQWMEITFETIKVQ